MSAYSIKLLNYTIITTYRLLSYILVSPPNPRPKVITTINSVVTSTLGGILLYYYLLYL